MQETNANPKCEYFNVFIHIYVPAKRLRAASVVTPGATPRTTSDIMPMMLHDKKPKQLLSYSFQLFRCLWQP